MAVAELLSTTPNVWSNLHVNSVGVTGSAAPVSVFSNAGAAEATLKPLLAGTNVTFVTTGTTVTVNVGGGTDTFANIKLTDTSNQITTSSGSAHPTTISVPEAAAARVVTIPDVGSDSSVVLDMASPQVLSIPNFTIAQITVNGSVSLVEDLYTVPTGKRAVLYEAVVYNADVESEPTNAAFGINLSDTLQPLTANVSIAASETQRFVSGYVFEAGEVAAMSFQFDNMFVTASFLVFPATFPITSYIATTFSPPVTIVEEAHAIGYGVRSFIPFTVGPPVVRYVNNTGGNESPGIYFAPAATHTSQRVYGSLTPTPTNTVLGASTGAMCAFGDQILATGDTSAGQFAYVTLYEPGPALRSLPRLRLEHKAASTKRPARKAPKKPVVGTPARPASAPRTARVAAKVVPAAAAPRGIPDNWDDEGSDLI